jgi:hypothetical protein
MHLIGGRSGADAIPLAGDTLGHSLGGAVGRDVGRHSSTPGKATFATSHDHVGRVSNRPLRAELRGIATRSAAELLVEVGVPRRFTEGGFARFNGSAPLPCSSGEGAGEPVRHRFNPHGNRPVNCVLHHMASPSCAATRGRDSSTTTPASEATRSQKPCASSSADSPTSSTAE